MTEITVNIDNGEKHKIDWIAFACALFLAPILVALLGFWAGIPLFALIFGPPTYLLFGAPTFAYALSRYDAGALSLAGWGFLANLLSIPAVYAYGVYEGDGIGIVKFIVGIGCVMAPLWALAFGLIYRKFRMPKV